MRLPFEFKYEITGMNREMLLVALPFGSPNTGYAIRFVRPNSAFGGTSQTPETLYEILLKKILTEG